jgi:DNA polymerase III epsilon subunit-like protein
MLNLTRRLTQPLPSVLQGQRLVVVDVEGNGRQPPEIVEIATLPLTGTSPVATSDLRSWLVRPAQPITSIVTRKVHGIRNEDVACCPPWREIATDVSVALAGRALVAHNASVERRVLGEHLPGWQPPLVLDTMRLAKALWPDMAGFALDRLVTLADITPPAIEPGQRPHRAGYDAVVTAELLLVLLEDAVTNQGLGWDEVVAAACLPGPRSASGAGTAEAPEAGLW